MFKEGDWTDEQIVLYPEGIKSSDYPAAKNHLKKIITSPGDNLPVPTPPECFDKMFKE